jgi:hypothetical protein
MRRLFAIALLATTTSCPFASQGQVRMGAGLSGAHWGTGSFARTRSGASFRFGDHRVPRQFFPSGYFFDAPFFADYLEAVPPQAPAVIVVQTAGPAPETKEQPTAEPLLIEWQGDRYVRHGGLEPTVSRGGSAPLDYAEATRIREKSSATRAVKVGESSAELPVVLIFRDGRREEAASYVIVGPTMYVCSNFWSSGSWSTKVQLADLDLPATSKVNQERGVKFVLPGGPNEVVTRP